MAENLGIKMCADSKENEAMKHNQLEFRISIRNLSERLDLFSQVWLLRKILTGTNPASLISI